MANSISFKDRVAITVYLESVRRRYTETATLNGNSLCNELRESLGLPTVKNSQIYAIAKQAELGWVADVVQRRIKNKKYSRNAAHDIRYVAKLLKALIPEIDRFRKELADLPPLFDAARLERLGILAESSATRKAESSNIP